MSDTTKHFDETNETVKSLIAKTNSKDLKGLMVKSFALCKTCVDLVDEGGAVVFRREDGTEETFDLATFLRNAEA